MIRHIVFWKLNGATPAQKRVQALEIKHALEALNGRIPGLLRLEVGIDFSATEESADVVLYSELESRAALEVYARHPDHVAVLPLVKAARSERRVVDFEV
jgi:Stress responsive A/B Barrel Domain